MKILCLVTALGTCLTPWIALAAEGDTPAQPDTLTKLEQYLHLQQQQLDDAQKKIADQLELIKKEEQALRDQQSQIDTLRTTLSAKTNATSQPTLQTLLTTRGAGEQYAQAPGGGATAPTAGSTSIDQTEPQVRPEISDVALASEGGVLTPKGVFSLEPSYQYQYISTNQVLLSGLTIIPGITLGSTDIRQLVDRINTFNLGGRLGITNRLEVEAQIPFVYRADDTTFTPTGGTTQVTNSSTGHDLGDISFGAHYQMNSGAGGWPYFIGNFLVKTRTGTDPFSVPVDFNTGLPTRLPTGTGFYTLQPSITAIYPSDPVAIFGNLRYNYNVGRTVTLQPTQFTSATAQSVSLHPGDGIGGTVGMGVGINDHASFSLAYEETYFFPTTENGQSLPGSYYDIGAFDLGFAYKFSPRTTVNLGVSIGTTKASPDTSIMLRIPVKFQVFE
jgi:hypothetical protein